MGYRIERLQAQGDGYDASVPLPASAQAELRPDNPRLLDLELRYQAVESPVANHTLWQKQLASKLDDLLFFRGDNAYIWQYRTTRAQTRLKYYLYARYIRDMDHRRLLGDTLTETGEFGCFAFQFHEIPAVSRDLLDSVNELYFLDRHWNIFERGPFEVLDIGAGYGRLADRMLTAVPNIRRYWCIDAIPRSTFLSEYYLKYRGHRTGSEADRAVVVPMDEMETGVPAGQIDLAVNIHSFSEMSYAAVETWLLWLRRLKVQWLLVIPNEPDMLSREADGSRREYKSLIARENFELVIREPTFLDRDIRNFVRTGDNFFLFKNAN